MQLAISLSAPNPDFLYNLTDNKLVILKSRRGKLSASSSTAPGHSCVAEMIPGDRAIFSANENYWRGEPSISTP